MDDFEAKVVRRGRDGRAVGGRGATAARVAAVAATNSLSAAADKPDIRACQRMLTEVSRGRVGA